MKILLAPNSFKESISAWRVCLSLERGIRKAAPKTIIYKIPLADGGLGTVDALLRPAKGHLYKKSVRGPLGRKVIAGYGVLEKGVTGVIEMASASGLHLVPFGRRDPRLTTTFGTGELIRACLDKGCKNIMVGVGDSATNDGGIGMAQALGIRFKDKSGCEIRQGGRGLVKIKHIDMGGLDKRVKNAKITILSDVKNPLCGPKGASAVYGPQKGALPRAVSELEQGLQNLARIIKQDLGIEIKNRPGAGAAGGLAAGLMAFLKGELVSGIETILKITDAERYVKKADLIITGEGKLDRQTIYGKAPMGVAKLAGRYCKPVIGIAGTLGRGSGLLYGRGFNSIFSIMERPATLAEAINETEGLLADTAERIMRIIVLSGKIR